MPRFFSLACPCLHKARYLTTLPREKRLSLLVMRQFRALHNEPMVCYRHRTIVAESINLRMGSGQACCFEWHTIRSETSIRLGWSRLYVRNSCISYFFFDCVRSQSIELGSSSTAWPASRRMYERVLFPGLISCSNNKVGTTPSKLKQVHRKRSRPTCLKYRQHGHSIDALDQTERFECVYVFEHCYIFLQVLLLQSDFSSF